MEKRNEMPPGSPASPVIGVVPRYDFEWTGLAVSDGYLSGLLETGAVPIVLPTTSDPAHIERIVAACDGFLIPGGQDIDPERYGHRREPHTHRSARARDKMEQALVRAVIEADKKELAKEFCRGCGYCAPCTVGIKINNAARMIQMIRRSPSDAWLGESWQKEMFKIEECIECGACLPRCPYELNIPELLKKNLEDYKNILAGKVQVRESEVL